jgi:AraC-like DNA-binding protein
MKIDKQRTNKAIEFRPGDIQFATTSAKKNWSSEQISFELNEHRDVAAPLFDANVLVVGFSERPAYRTPEERLDSHRLRIPLHGCLSVCMDGVEHNVHPGQLAVAPAGTIFSNRNASPVWSIYLSLADVERWHRFRETGPYIRDYESTYLFYLLLRGIIDAKNTMEHFDRMLAIDHAVSLLRLLIHETRRTGSRPSPFRAQMVSLMGEVSKNPGHAWRVTEMADMLHVSPPYLTKLFRDEFGSSPMRNVTRIRMQEAMSQLVNTQRNVAEIAFTVGYESQFSFSRLFKKHTGMSPRDYRGEHRVY